MGFVGIAQKDDIVYFAADFAVRSDYRCAVDAFVASFSDGGSSSGFTDVPLASFLDTATRVMARRGVELTEADSRMFAKIKAAAEQYK